MAIEGILETCPYDGYIATVFVPCGKKIQWTLQNNDFEDNAPPICVGYTLIDEHNFKLNDDVRQND
jgi:hypothetical protein